MDRWKDEWLKPYIGKDEIFLIGINDLKKIKEDRVTMEWE